MSNDNAAWRAISTSFRSLADVLDALLQQTGDRPTMVRSTITSSHLEPGSVFDPQRDRPPVAPAPQGSREQADWCGLLFFGQLWAINVREQRGATVSEQTAIARAAGYQDRRAFAGWQWTWADREDGRWITEDDELSPNDKARGRSSGMAFLRWYAEAVGVRLPDDMPTHKQP